MTAYSSSPPRRKRILVVEDDAASAELLVAFLSEDYDVVVARDGLEGVELAAEYLPDLIITDVSMPRLGGIAMVRHIRTRQGLKSPVIFLSALGTPHDVIAGISAGARHYLVKPVKLDELEQRVSCALGHPSSPPSFAGFIKR